MFAPSRAATASDAPPPVASGFQALSTAMLPGPPSRKTNAQHGRLTRRSKAAPTTARPSRLNASCPQPSDWTRTGVNARHH